MRNHQPSKKTIRCFCLSPILCGYSVGWDDVWLRFKSKRKIVKLAPCISGLDDLKYEISECQYMALHFPQYQDSKEYYDAVLSADRRFKDGESYFYYEPEFGFPTIFVNKKHLVKKDFENAITWYLERKGYLCSEPRFQWKKYRAYSVPVTLMAPPEEQ